MVAWLRRLESAARGEAERDAVGRRAHHREVDDRLRIGLEEERTDGVAAGDE